jgi:protoporphyrinogen oxidase
MNENKFDLTIVGGGITGLAAAYISAKQGAKVRILEAGPEFGGLLQTFEIGGNRLEHYYHHFFTHDAEIHWLVKDLGIEDMLVYKKTTMGNYRNGKLYPFNGAMDLLRYRPMNFLGKLRFGFSSIYLSKFADWRKNEHISALSWFYENVGESATDSLWKPMLDIKFGPYANKVPLSWMIGRLRQRMNSRKSGDERLGYLKGSLQTLLTALLSKLKVLNVEMHSNSPVSKINFSSLQEVISLESGMKTFSSYKYLFTTPGTVTGNLLPPFGFSRDKLESVKYFGAVCVILEMNKKLSDTYWINVADPGFEFGGVIEHTNFISPENYNGKHIAYLSRYFDLSHPLFNADNEHIKHKMVSQLKYIFPNFDPLQIENVHVFKTRTAAPVCDLNFSSKVVPCATEFTNLFIANMAHVYPDERSANNSIRIAAEACRVMGFDKCAVPKGSSMSGLIGF